MDLQRASSKLRASGHRKKLYCIHCRKECNTIEIRNEFEREEFLKAFEKGQFKDEAKESIEKCEKSSISW